MPIRRSTNNQVIQNKSETSRGGMLSALAMAALPVIGFPVVAHADEADAGDQRNIYVDGRRTADVNPNANPEAPYKVEKSADGKFTEPLRDTPKTITAIPKEVIEDIGATSFREVVRSTPGVTLGTGEGGNAFGDRIFIRGFDARGDVYIDGLRDPGVTSREIFAVEQIEVVKGPSGSFGGRGTTGGLVSLQSKQPQFGNDFVVAEGGVGTENYFRATADANYALSDRFAIRVNGLYHSADTPGRDYVDSERWGVAAAATFKVTDTLTVMADYYGYRLDGMSDYGHPFESDDYNDGDAGGLPNEPAQVNLDNFYGAVGRDFIENGSDIGTLTVKFEPNDQIALRSTVRYGETWNYYVVSVPRSPRAVTPPAADASQREIDGYDAAIAAGFMDGDLVVDTGAPQRHADNETFAMLTDATARFDTGSIGHTLVGGVEITREKIDNKRYTFPDFIEDANGNNQPTPDIPPRDLFNPDPVLGFSIPAVIDTSVPSTIVKVETMSAYLIDTVKFSPKLQATLGLRYDMFDINVNGFDRRSNAPYSRQQSIDFLNGQVSLLYKPVEPVSIYASFSTSSNPSGEQLDSTSATYGGLGDGTETIDPERNKAYELGVKYELNKNLLLTAAVFQIDKENAREADPVSGGFNLVGELRSRGAEIGVNGNLTSRWSVFGGFTYLDAEIVDSSDALEIGSRFPNVPKYNFSLLSTYALTDWLMVGGQAYYQSRIFGGTYGLTTTDDNINPSVPGYWRFDAVARVRPTQNTELRLNVMNLTDKRYYDAIYRSSAPFAYVAPGRSATLTASIIF